MSDTPPVVPQSPAPATESAVAGVPVEMQIQDLHGKLHKCHVEVQIAANRVIHSGDLYYRLSAIIDHPAQPDPDIVGSLLQQAADDFRGSWEELARVSAEGCEVVSNLVRLQHERDIDSLMETT